MNNLLNRGNDERDIRIGQRNVALSVAGISAGRGDACLCAKHALQPIPFREELPFGALLRSLRHTSATVFVRNNTYSHVTA